MTAPIAARTITGITVQISSSRVWPYTWAPSAVRARPRRRYFQMNTTSAPSTATKIFVAVEGALVVFIWKYRRRGRARTAEGAQVYGHTRLELIWTVIPVIVLAAIGAVIFYELPGIKDAPAAVNPIRITVEGHQ